MRVTRNEPRREVVLHPVRYPGVTGLTGIERQSGPTLTLREMIQSAIEMGFTLVQNGSGYDYADAKLYDVTGRLPDDVLEEVVVWDGWDTAYLVDRSKIVEGGMHPVRWDRWPFHFSGLNFDGGRI